MSICDKINLFFLWGGISKEEDLVIEKTLSLVGKRLPR